MEIAAQIKANEPTVERFSKHPLAILFILCHWNGIFCCHKNRYDRIKFNDIERPECVFHSGYITFCRLCLQFFYKTRHLQINVLCTYTKPENYARKNVLWCVKKKEQVYERGKKRFLLRLKCWKNIEMFSFLTYACLCLCGWCFFSVEQGIVHGEWKRFNRNTTYQLLKSTQIFWFHIWLTLWHHWHVTEQKIKRNTHETSDFFPF